MTGRKFKQLVRIEAHIGDVRPPLTIVDETSDLFVSLGMTAQDHVTLAIKIAEHVSAKEKTEQKKQTRSLALGLNSPEAVVNCLQREEAVRPVVERLRREYFGETAVPFPSYAKATEWLRRQAVVGRPGTPKEMLRLVNAVTTAMQRFPKHMALEFSMGSHAIPLLAQKPGALQGGVSFDQGTVLENLRKATASMSNGTGCDRALCVAHVLTGAPLVLRPLEWSIEFSHGCGLWRRSATIHILQPHAMTLPELAKAYRVIRQELGLVKQKTMTDQHQRLLQLVEKLGGVPIGGKKTEFWEKVRCAWNKAIPKGEHPYETWRSPMMAYRRIQAQLKRRVNV